MAFFRTTLEIQNSHPANGPINNTSSMPMVALLFRGLAGREEAGMPPQASAAGHDGQSNRA